MSVRAGRIAANTGHVRRIKNSNGFRMFMLLVVLFCVDLFMLFQVLRPLEGFLADLMTKINIPKNNDGMMIATSQIWGLSGVWTAKGYEICRN